MQINMQIIILIAFGTFFVLSVLFFIFYIIATNKNSKMASELEKLGNDLKFLKQKYELAIEGLKPKRSGWYKETINLMSKEEHKNGGKGDPYETMIYVQEIDRYTNGTCKVQLSKIEIISGFKNDQYEWVKSLLTKKFISIKKISDVEWLESEEDIKKLRKEKLKKLENME